MVAEDSIEMQADGVTVAFIVTDHAETRIPVRYNGILPDLFVEGSGVVAEGSLAADGTFIATNLLAKHDENYVPRELEDMHQAGGAQNAELTTVGLK
jgi:cytochrome c-type biogenesis protein CcmE